MAKRKVPGLKRQSGKWYMDKIVCGKRIVGSTHTDSLDLAELILAKKIEEVRNESMLRIKKSRTFRETAGKWMSIHANQILPSFKTSCFFISQLDPYIGDLYIDEICDESFEQLIEDPPNPPCGKKKGVKNKTINASLEIATRILSACHYQYRDSGKNPWLRVIPKIKRLPLSDEAKPYTLDWFEQEKLFKRLAPHLRSMAILMVNTGLRDQEVALLSLHWETIVPELGNRSCFLIPGKKEYAWSDELNDFDYSICLWEGTKNKKDKLVVLNKEARAVVDEQRGKHGEFVFTYKGSPVTRMNNNGWQRAWRDVGLPEHGKVKKGGHNLRHTFAERLRGMDVSKETRALLLGHATGDITTHYSGAGLIELFDAVDQLMVAKEQKLTIVKANFGQYRRKASSHKSHTEV